MTEQNSNTGKKKCSQCKEIKSKTEFYRDKYQGTGFTPYCKVCAKKYDNGKKYLRLKERDLAEGRVRVLTLEQQERKRETARIWHNNNPEKHKAHNLVRKALRKGELKKLACEECGEERVHAHHADYSKPLEVRWLCNQHHRQAHGKSALVVMTKQEFQTAVDSRLRLQLSDIIKLIEGWNKTVGNDVLYPDLRDYLKDLKEKE